MSYLHCPVCGLNVPRTAETTVGAEACPRCLARSSGTLSVKLTPGRSRESTPNRGRVSEFLRELRPGSAKR
jgi:Zn-finger nucleic acid-binding protein